MWGTAAGQPIPNSFSCNRQLPLFSRASPLAPRPLQEALDAQLAAVFGTADLTSSKSLGLTEFLRCLHAHHLARIRARPTLRSMRKGDGGGEPRPGSATAAAAAAR